MQRWKQVKLNIERECGIVTDFVGFHDTYLDAFTYLTKQDSHYVTSPGHVDLDKRSLKTSTAIHANRVAELASRTTHQKKNNTNQNNATVVK